MVGEITCLIFEQINFYRSYASEDFRGFLYALTPFFRVISEKWVNETANASRNL